MRWQDFLYFQKGEKLAVILLMIVIILAMLLNIFLEQRNSREVVLMQNDSIVREFKKFQQSLRTDRVDTNEKTHSYYSSRQTRHPEGIGTNKKRNSRVEDSAFSYPPVYRQAKLAEGETIRLNESDTTEWKKVPGIGSTFASRIVKYRNLLGGFVSVEQLREVYGIDNELFSRISPYIQADENFRKLWINELEFKELLSHPYLNYKQVQAIVNLRKKKGNIASIHELAMLDEFTPEDIFRIEPYLAF